MEISLKVIDELLNSFIDPISLEIMMDPVIAADSVTYERKSIEMWFTACMNNGQQVRSPATNQPLRNRELLANVSLRYTISLVMTLCVELQTQNLLSEVNQKVCLRYQELAKQQIYKERVQSFCSRLSLRCTRNHVMQYFQGKTQGTVINRRKCDGCGFGDLYQTPCYFYCNTCSFTFCHVCAEARARFEEFRKVNKLECANTLRLLKASSSAEVVSKYINRLQSEGLIAPQSGIKPYYCLKSDEEKATTICIVDPFEDVDLEQARLLTRMMSNCNEGHTMTRLEETSPYNTGPNVNCSTCQRKHLQHDEYFMHCEICFVEKCYECAPNFVAEFRRKWRGFPCIKCKGNSLMEGVKPKSQSEELRCQQKLKVICSLCWKSNLQDRIGQLYFSCSQCQHNLCEACGTVYETNTV